MKLTKWHVEIKMHSKVAPDKLQSDQNIRYPHKTNKLTGIYACWRRCSSPRVTPFASVVDGSGCRLIVKDVTIITKQFTLKTRVAKQGHAGLPSMKWCPQREGGARFRCRDTTDSMMSWSANCLILFIWINKTCFMWSCPLKWLSPRFQADKFSLSPLKEPAFSRHVHQQTDEVKIKTSNNRFSFKASCWFYMQYRKRVLEWWLAGSDEDNTVMHHSLPVT